MAVNILLKRSATASKRPTGASMAFGELNLNYDASTGGLFYKDSLGSVVKVGPCQVSATAPNSSPAGSSGNSRGEFWYDTSTSTLKVFDGSTWQETGGAVQGVTGTSPITVDNTDPFNPVVSVDSASTTAPGVVQLNDTTTSTSTTEALTANQGYNLQQQIDALVISSNLTLAGTFDASTGLVDSVTVAGTAAGFTVGSALPTPASGNADYFVIVDVLGSTGPAGTPPYHVGDWFLSDGTSWQFLNVGFQAPYATTTAEGVVQLATDAEVQAGVNTDHAVTPSGLQSKVSDSTSTTSSTVIASSTAVKSAYDLADAAMPKTGGIFTGGVTFDLTPTWISDIGPASQVTFDNTVENILAATYVQGAIDEITTSYLSKGGGAMTGTLSISAGVDLSVEMGANLNSSGTVNFYGTTNLHGATDFLFTPTWQDNIGDAAKVLYDNATSGLAATNVQDAIDELDVTADAAMPKAGGNFTGNVTFDPGTTTTVDAGANFTMDGQAYFSGSTNFEGTSNTTYLPGSTVAFQNSLTVGESPTSYTLPVADGAADYILATDGAGTVSWVANAADGVQSVTGTSPITVDITDPANPIVGIDAASTTAAGAVQLNDTVTSTSTTEAATANAVKTAYDLAVTSQAAAPMASARTLFVNLTTGNDSTGTRGTAKPYATITAALAAASEGDTIFVAPGTYVESPTLSKGVNLVGTFVDQAISSGPKISGTFTVSISGALSRNWSVSGFQFQASSVGNNTAVVSNNSFGSGGIGTFTNCFFQQFSSGSLTEQCFTTSGTWTRSLYLRNCTFDGNFTHNAGTTAGASGYIVLDNLLGIAGSDKYYKVMTGTCEFRNPSNALAPVLHTGGFAVFSNVLAWISNVAATTTIFGGTGFAYKGTSAGLGQAVVYFAGQGVNVVEGSTWGKLSVGTNVVYAFGNVNYDTSLATLSGIPLTVAAPNPNGVLANMARPQWNYLTTTSSVAAANQVGVVLDNTNGNVYTVTAFDAGTY